jgi:hypothetical protein
MYFNIRTSRISAKKGKNLLFGCIRHLVCLGNERRDSAPCYMISSLSVAIPRDYDVIFGIISKTNIARFGKEKSRKYFISVPISLGYAPIYGKNISFPQNIGSSSVYKPFYQTLCITLEVACIRAGFSCKLFRFLALSGLRHD